ncbi:MULTISPECIES: hypothetical protein [unclassified Microbacterium]|uniref:hypothetical protein n=1 Tax=unclassified Microbacterium TaxID=2609290 RepID=UPI002469202A|nr:MULTISPECIES: hypothetical protein [unclassified Microbacterium]MDH5134982.1 hypothetical protein [Microbacterium sp. RD10]MDH5138553.1 hypothetical protein [Microbacterium sp. RD11]MDH5146929.1 hypothetical protein [Microbacterium sp. RD12]MDH5156629.1 hypothetical protein [Microbacterium sp. RD06]MDH5168093.1 hypothetical protein [Microbacterium sp. RD02]
MKNLTEIKRWATLRCEHCGHRFRWSRDARHSFGNRDGKVYHRPCLEGIVWRSKADDRLAVLDVVTEVAGISNRLVTGVIEIRATSEDERITASNQSWRVFRDLDTMRDDHEKVLP